MADIFYKAHTSKLCGLCFELSIAAFEETCTCSLYTNMMLVTSDRFKG